MKKFEVSFASRQITVTNSLLHERLFVAGALQDHAFGFGHRSLLWGSLIDEDGTKRVIKARLGGALWITCDIFVDDVQVMSQGRPVEAGGCHIRC